VNPVNANFFADLEEFASSHRPHGPLTADATEPEWTTCSPWPVRAAWCLSGGSRRKTLTLTCSDSRG
jgi:hypothetical protein